MDRLGVSSPRVFDDSPFSNLAKERVIFLFGAMDEFLESFKDEGFVSWKGKQEWWKKMCIKKTVPKGLKREMKYNGFVHNKVVTWKLGKSNNEREQKLIGL